MKAKKHERHAESLARQGKLQEAIEEYKTAIEIAPYEDEILYVSVGTGFSELQQYEIALRYYEIALEINPNNQQVVGNFMLVKKMAGVT